MPLILEGKERWLVADGLVADALGVPERTLSDILTWGASEAEQQRK